MITIRRVLIIIVALLSFFLGGCWNYRGIDELETVIGLAIDEGTRKNSYLLTYENVDLSLAGGPQGIIKSKFLQSEGTTIFDAIRKAEKRAGNKLYFNQMQVIIVSDKIAKEVGIKTILEWIMKDGETRENLHFVISPGNARDLFSAKPISMTFVSMEINKIIEDDKVSSFTKNIHMYEMFDILNTEGISLFLPVFSTVQNDKEKTIESSGSAVFKKSRMIGSISSDDTQSALFVADEVHGGLLTADLNKKGRDDISLEIDASKTKLKYTFDGKQVGFKVDVETSVYLSEIPGNINLLNPENQKRVEAAAGDRLKKRIEKVIKTIQTDFGSDIFGFGLTIRQKDNHLWYQLNKKWDDYFKNTKVQVNCKIKIKNTGISK